MFKTITIFPENGQFYKGNLHSHTTNSDGHLTPEEAVALFKSQGYHFLCLSEHDRTPITAQNLTAMRLSSCPGSKLRQISSILQAGSG